MNKCEVAAFVAVASILVAALGTALAKAFPSKTRSILVSTLLLVIVIVVLTALMTQKKEKFYFEVSPSRKKCLEEQVSRKNFGRKRSCSCCGRGTTGGIPPNYAEWLNVDEDTKSRWHRPDFVQYVDTFSNSEEASCNACGPPSYVTYL